MHKKLQGSLMFKDAALCNYTIKINVNNTILAWRYMDVFLHKYLCTNADKELPTIS